MAVNIIREIKPMKRKVSPYKEDFAASIPVSSMKDEKHISISRNPVVTAHANRSKIPQLRERQANGCWHRVSFAVPFPVDGLSCG